MSRGGHNWTGGGTVEGARALDVMKLARSGYLAGSLLGTWRWTYSDGATSSIVIFGGRDAVTLDYPIRSHGSRSSSACRSTGPRAGSVESDPGSFAMFGPTGCTAAGRSPSCKAPGGCSPAGTATGSAMGAAGRPDLFGKVSSGVAHRPSPARGTTKRRPVLWPPGNRFPKASRSILPETLEATSIKFCVSDVC